MRLFYMLYQALEGNDKIKITGEGPFDARGDYITNMNIRFSASKLERRE